ncbi:MAG: cupin domain-containing protein [Anaerolineaceae bacterium]|nr:cupin domain-containing protein [Anaerolineaceae bacterium]
MKINLQNSFSEIKTYWSPKILAEVNDQYIKAAKLKGDIVWHKHENEDEMFLVMKGSLTLNFENAENVTLQTGECYVVPKGVLHQPVAEEECHVMLIESKTTKHTGDQITPQTKSIEDQLAK